MPARKPRPRPGAAPRPVPVFTPDGAEIARPALLHDKTATRSMLLPAFASISVALAGMTIPSFIHDFASDGRWRSLAPAVAECLADALPPATADQPTHAAPFVIRTGGLGDWHNPGPRRQVVILHSDTVTGAEADHLVATLTARGARNPDSACAALPEAGASQPPANQALPNTRSPR